MARVAPEDKYAGLADERAARARLPRSRPDRPRSADASPSWRTWRARRKRPALAVKGVSQSGGASASAGIGGMVLATSHGFRGAYLGSQPRHLDAGDRRRRHRHGARLRLFMRRRTRADLESPEKIGRNAGERAVARLNPRKVATRKVPVVFDPRVAGSLVAHLAGAVNGASIARKTSFLRTRWAQKIFADGIRIIDDPLRKRGLRSRPFDGEGVAGERAGADRRRRAADPGFSTAPPRANSGSPPTAAPRAASPRRPRPSPSNLHMAAGTVTPEAADRRHQGRLLCHRPDRHGRQHGDRRLQPRRLRLLDRERRAHLSGQRGHHRRTSARHVPLADARPTIWNSATAPTRRRCGWRGSPLPGSDPARIARALDAARCARPAKSRASPPRRRSSTGPRARTIRRSARPTSRSTISCARGCAALAPDAGWLSEETEDDPARTRRRRVWIVDPIDGTRAYLAGRAGLDHLGRAGRGRPAGTGGALCAGDRGDVPRRAGGGATLNDAPIASAAGKVLPARGVAGPKAHARTARSAAPDVLPQPKVHSLALRLTRVAQGELDAAFAVKRQP